MAGRVGARGLVADHFHAREHPAPLGGLEDAHAVLLRQALERALGLVALRAAFGLAVHFQADLRGERGVDDHALLVEDAHAVDVLLARDVLDDVVHVVRARLQHGEARAAHDDVRELAHVPGGGVEQLAALLPDHQHGEGEQRRHQGDAERQRHLDS